MAQFEKYHLLSSSDESVQDFLSLSRPKRFHGYSFSAIGFGLLLILSITLNTYLGVEKLRGGYVGTKWANLKHDVPTPIYSSTEYGPAIGTEEERDRRWELLDISDGIIAMPDALAIQYGLPLSERFPWEQNSGVYLLGGHHQVHCLKNIYRFVSATHQGRASELSYEHIVHCLDNLLQQTFCQADDTPWMQLPPQPYRQKYAEYQTRQCRSWDKMMAWARKYNACYKNENIQDMYGNPTKEPFEHFKYCPEGSPYKALMEKFFEQRAQGINATEAYNAIHAEF